MLRYFVLVMPFMSFITFFVYAFDKKKAVNGRWRIPERTLLFLAAAGGAAGAYAGMKVFHHKTRKPLFAIPVPLMALLQVFLFLKYFAA